MKITPWNSTRAPQPAGGYSQAVEVQAPSRFLFVSGQIPVAAGGEVPRDFHAQARLVWANLAAQLESAGMGISNLVKVTISLSSREFADANRDVRREVLGAHAPALTVIITGIFDEAWLLEIEAVAAA
jgi:2-iminobutanoate/2-iminopropanoate deaminase